MMALLSLAWWGRKLSGISAQAMAVVALVAVIVVGISWAVHEARAALASARSDGFEAGKAVNAVSTAAGAIETASAKREAEASIPLTTEREKIIADCKRDPACRNRGSLK